MSPLDGPARQAGENARLLRPAGPPAGPYSKAMDTATSSAAEGRVFVARLAGTGVFDPLGDRVGRVADVVVLLRAAAPPRALGLVVEVTRKRRVFLPLSRVMSIKPGAVISTGVLNMRRFKRRPSETLVVAELVDRTVDLTSGDGPVTIDDVAMQRQRNRDWLVTHLSVHESTGRSLRRRRRAQRIVAVTAARSLHGRHDHQPATTLLASIEGLKAADVADVLHDLPAPRRLAVAGELRDERLADVIEELGDEARVALVSGLGRQRAADVLDAMQPDDAADLINELPAEAAAALLELMAPAEAQDVRRLIRYEEHTAGGLMTTEAVILPPESSVAVALASARRPDLPPAT